MNLARYSVSRLGAHELVLTNKKFADEQISLWALGGRVRARLSSWALKVGEKKPRFLSALCVLLHTAQPLFLVRCRRWVRCQKFVGTRAGETKLGRHSQKSAPLSFLLCKPPIERILLRVCALMSSYSSCTRSCVPSVPSQTFSKVSAMVYVRY